MSSPPSKGGFALYSEKLIDQGYEVISIKPGAKAPHGDDWQKLRYTKSQARATSALRPTAGLGILTRLTPAVDIDLLNEDVALYMQEWTETHFGFAPLRIGMAPKRLLMFRAAEPFSKVNSKTFIDPTGNPNASKTQSGKPNGDWRKVEVLGDGNQFVAYAVHPDTGRPYEWIGKASPLTVAHDKLPLLDRAGAERIVAEFERYVTSLGWKVKANDTLLKSPTANLPAARPLGRVDTENVFATDTPKTDIATEELHRKLLLTPGAADYDTWVQVGMALYHQFDGGETGLNMWDEWSKTAPNYDNDVLDTHWRSFDVEGKGRAPVTARLIIKMADEQAKKIAHETFRDIRDELNFSKNREAFNAVCVKIKTIEFDVLQRSELVDIVRRKFKALTKATLSLAEGRKLIAYQNPSPKDMPRWLEGYVYIQQTEEFYSGRTRQALSTVAFNATYGMYMLKQSDILEGKSSPETLPSNFALHNKQIEKVARLMYMPGEEDGVFLYNGKRVVNSYDTTNVPEMPEKLTAAEAAAVETAKGHLEHLFEDESERIFLLDCMAYLVQNPNKRLRFGILMQGVEEDGKSWFAGLLATVLGPENVKNIPAQALEEKFNRWSEGAQITFIEEIKLQGHNRFDVINKVKPLLTNAMVSIRRMNTDQYDTPNTVTYFLTTNYIDALPLSDNDSRYWIAKSRFKSREALMAFNRTDPTYYTRLYDALAHGGALRRWLAYHKISDSFDPTKRAPMSRGKREMINLAKSEEMLALEHVLAESTEPGLDEYVLDTNRLAEAIGEQGVTPPYGRGLSRMLIDAGFTRVGKIRVGDKTPVIWSRHPQRFLIPGAKKTDEPQPNILRIKNWLETVL